MSESTSESTVPWYKRAVSWLFGAAKAVAATIYEIIAPAVKSAALQFVNDKENQRVALAAVRAAMSGGLKGNAAWDVARADLVAQFGSSAQAIADNWLDTLLQTAYFSFKNAIDQE